MAMFEIIPNDQAKFQAFVAALPAGDAVKKMLLHSQLIRVLVDAAAGSWHICLTAPPQVPADVWTTVGQVMSRCAGVDVVCHPITVAAPQYWLAHREDIIRAVSGGNSVAAQILQTASWQWDGREVVITVPGRLAVDILAQDHIDQSLRQLFSQTCADVSLKVVAAAPPEPAEDGDEALLTADYQEAVQTLAEERRPSSRGEAVIWGKKIKDAPTPLNQVQEEERRVTVMGQVNNIVTRELRSGRTLITFDLVDDSDGISGKLFFDDEAACQKVAAALKPGSTVVMQGAVQFDRYQNELVIYPDNICAAAIAVRQDNAPMTRVELHAHTQMSALDAITDTEELIKTAAAWHHPAVAITDHGVVQAFPAAYSWGEKYGVKVIYGMEGYIYDDDINTARHIIILVRNHVGLRNLYRLVTLSHLKFFHRTPRFPRTVLTELREGLLVGSACEAGELFQAVLHGETDERLRHIAAYYDYLEIQPVGNNGFLLRENRVKDEEELRDINRRICRLGAEMDKPVVATGDVHFLQPHDEVYRRILMAGQGYSDADEQPPLYFHTTEEMLAEFAYLGEDKAYEIVVENPRRISEQVAAIKPIPDHLYAPQIPGAAEAITDMAHRRAKELYGDPLPDIVAQRLRQELDSIVTHGFAVLYYIAHKLVKKSLDDGYLVGSRGSVGSSFVATMSGITEVNPLPPHWYCPACHYSEFVTDGSVGSGFDLEDKACPRCGATKMCKDGHNIPFAVFMGFHGDKVPDIDLNFSGVYQPVAHKYTEELFGKDNVFRAGTIATIADKTAYGFVKNYLSEHNCTSRTARVNSLLAGCTGVKRTTGQHPGGIMVVPRDMDVHHFTPLQHPADDKNSSTITTHFDYHSISSRLVKLDILGHDDPTVLRMLQDLTGVNPKTIPFDDNATMSIFSSPDALGVSAAELGCPVGTLGIPEFGTKFVRQMLEDTTPRTFSELVRISGFSHGTDVWLNNAQDLIRAGTAKLSEAISARDDIMVYLRQKGVAPQQAFKIMENVRKGKGISEADVQVMQEHDVPAWFIGSCQKIKYLFPKAHATAYVMMAFRIAYFKVHYPLAFYAAYFTVRAAEFDAAITRGGAQSIKAALTQLEQKGNALTAKERNLLTILEVAYEMTLRGLVFKPVDLYQSAAVQFTMQADGLLPPLAALAGLGENAARSIVAARQERPFTSVQDLRSRGRLSKTVLDILASQGCLDKLPETDQTILFA